MSKMSDLDLMVREGDRTAEDFIKRGIDARTARAMAAVVEASNVEPVDAVLGEGRLANDIAGDRVKASFEPCPHCIRGSVVAGGICRACSGSGAAKSEEGPAEPEGAFGHGPGCFGECDGQYDCS